MSGACLRLKVALFSRWLAVKPTLPAVRLDSDASSFTATFTYKPPTVYNTNDRFELQARADRATQAQQR